MKSKPEKFKTEAEMCKAFIDAIPKRWTPYPETCGWDILLVRKTDGFQIGFQAKLHLNNKVLLQCLYDYWEQGVTGPDCRAILVPEFETQNGVDRIAQHLAITVVSVRKELAYWQSRYNPKLPGEPYATEDQRTWPEWCPDHRCKLPDYVPDSKSGSPSPITLTPWKINAIKLAVLMDKQGFLTRSDFKALHVDIRRWTDGRWLQPNPAGHGYVKGPHFPDLNGHHPVNFEQIEADFEKWKPAISKVAI